MCNDTIGHYSARPVEPDLPPGQDPVVSPVRLQDVLRDQGLLYAVDEILAELGARNDQKKRIAALEAELAAARDESRELLTIAHMDGYHRGSRGLQALIINNTILRARVVELKEDLSRAYRLILLTAEALDGTIDRAIRTETERAEVPA